MLSWVLSHITLSLSWVISSLALSSVLSNIVWDVIKKLTSVLTRSAWRRAQPRLQGAGLFALVAIVALTAKPLPLKPTPGRRRHGRGRHHERFRQALQLSDPAYLDQFPSYVPPPK